MRILVCALAVVGWRWRLSPARRRGAARPRRRAAYSRLRLPPSYWPRRGPPLWLHQLSDWDPGHSASERGRLRRFRTSSRAAPVARGYVHNP